MGGQVVEEALHPNRTASWNGKRYTFIWLRIKTERKEKLTSAFSLPYRPEKCLKPLPLKQLPKASGIPVPSSVFLPQFL